LVTASLDGSARVWDAQTGEPLTDPLKHGSAVSTVVFTSDGLRVLTASLDRTARLWDGASGQPLADPLVHGGALHAAHLSPDSHWILTGGEGTTAHLWERSLAPIPVPDWLPDLAEAIATKRLNVRNKTEAPSAALSALRKDLEILTGDDYYSRWVRWFFADRCTRTISPSSPITVSEQITRLIKHDSLDSLREALRLAPTNGLVLAQLAQKLRLSKRPWNVAETGDPDWYSQRSIQLAPDDPVVWRLRAEHLALSEHFREAQAAAERLVELTPRNADNWNLEGRLLEKNGQFEQALEAYTKATDL